MEKLERRFTMLMVCAVWVHLTHDALWLCLAVPTAAWLYALACVAHEARETKLQSEAR